jgi:hypothetical protein
MLFVVDCVKCRSRRIVRYNVGLQRMRIRVGVKGKVVPVLN